MTDNINPFLAGLKARCPACGKGALFSGYLKFAERCEVCGEDFTKADAGDGPAVFVMLAAGAIIVPLVLGVELSLRPPLWVHAVLWLPVTAVATLGLLRPFKATLFALQHANDAEQARLEE